MILYTLADWFFPNAQTPLVIRCCHPRLLISNISGATSVHLKSVPWNLISFEEGFTHTHFTRNAGVGNIPSRKGIYPRAFHEKCASEIFRLEKWLELTRHQKIMMADNWHFGIKRELVFAFMIFFWFGGHFVSKRVDFQILCKFCAKWPPKMAQNLNKLKI